MLEVQTENLDMDSLSVSSKEIFVPKDCLKGAPDKKIEEKYKNLDLLKIMYGSVILWREWI